MTGPFFIISPSAESSDGQETILLGKLVSQNEVAVFEQFGL
jgi:hypothetical protein